MRLSAMISGSVLLFAMGCSSGAADTPAAPPLQSGAPQQEQAQGQEANIEAGVPGHDFEIRLIAEGLNVPWEFVQAEDGKMYFTERPGVLRVLENGSVRNEPLLEVPAPFLSRGEGGLLGLALDPEFMTNGYAYVYHTYEENGETLNRVLRLHIKEDQATIDKVLLDQIPGSSNHNGGRLRIGPDGTLYVTTGDKSDAMLAQDRESLAGKILRIKLDGTIPEDNPVANSPVYSWGHRNPQGLAWDLTSGQLYSSEHGASAHDEINVIEAGANYGWPLIQGDEAASDESSEELRTPLLHSGQDTWAPSGMELIQAGPWQGKLVVAGLRGEGLLLIEPQEEGSTLADAGTSPSAELRFEGEWGRIRGVMEGKDGTIYIWTNNRDGRGSPTDQDDRLLALVPRN
ncbi:PQQ-dependent sugar dehydrogenase [Paenibacillus massiliensis]|uniref:PQQ-dependent sugar dehydrogenase n=1 Tax=Paenibacillus massiliensis TaxID=225917 RepID=UPI0012B604C2|nr:PQQ-dependent sugar dehydrogenase [Paenibacillus massiliensis]